MTLLISVASIFHRRELVKTRGPLLLLALETLLLLALETLLRGPLLLLPLLLRRRSQEPRQAKTRGL